MKACSKIFSPLKATKFRPVCVAGGWRLLVGRCQSDWSDYKLN